MSTKPPADIFISYPQQDHAPASELKKWIEAKRLGVCYTYRLDNDAGDWREQLCLHLKNCRVCIIIVNGSSAWRPWLNYEAGWIDAREGDATIIPLCLAGKELPGTIETKWAYDWKDEDDRKKFVRFLFATFRPDVKHPPDPPKLVSSPSEPGELLNRIREGFRSREEELEGKSLQSADHPLTFAILKLLWNRYKDAVESYCKKESIPLGSGARREVAIHSIRKSTKFVWAVSMDNTDEWIRYKDYRAAILKAISQIEQKAPEVLADDEPPPLCLILVHLSGEASRGKDVENFISKYASRGSVIYHCPEDCYKETFKRYFNHKLLICDAGLHPGLVTQSLPLIPGSRGEQGKVSCDTATVEGAIENFRLAWSEFVEYQK